jgi:hypothetical protein
MLFVSGVLAMSREKLRRYWDNLYFLADDFDLRVVRADEVRYLGKYV